jgi:hypothetical protein
MMLYDKEFSMYGAAILDYIILMQGITVHTSASFEQKMNTYFDFNADCGIGYLFDLRDISLPLWIAPGISLTGMWGEHLFQPCIVFGAGIRYHGGHRVGIGCGLEHARYQNNIGRSRLTLGIFFRKPRVVRTR